MAQQTPVHRHGDGQDRPEADCFGPGTGGAGAEVTLQGPTALGAVWSTRPRPTRDLRPIWVTDAFSFGLGLCAIGGKEPPSSGFWYLKVEPRRVPGRRRPGRRRGRGRRPLVPGAEFPAARRAGAGRPRARAARRAVPGQVFSYTDDGDRSARRRARSSAGPSSPPTRTGTRRSRRRRRARSRSRRLWARHPVERRQPDGRRGAGPVRRTGRRARSSAAASATGSAARRGPKRSPPAAATTGSTPPAAAPTRWTAARAGTGRSSTRSTTCGAATGCAAGRMPLRRRPQPRGRGGARVRRRGRRLRGRRRARPRRATAYLTVTRDYGAERLLEATRRRPARVGDRAALARPRGRHHDALRRRLRAVDRGSRGQRGGAGASTGSSTSTGSSRQSAPPKCASTAATASGGTTASGRPRCACRRSSARGPSRSRTASEGKRFPVRIDCLGADDELLCRRRQPRVRGRRGEHRRAGGAQRGRAASGRGRAVGRGPRRQRGGPDRGRARRRAAFSPTSSRRAAADTTWSRSTPTAGGDARRAGTGLVAAVREGEEQPTWVVTGTDEAGVEAAVELLDAESLRDHYAVASTAGGERAPAAGDAMRTALAYTPRPRPPPARRRHRCDRLPRLLRRARVHLLEPDRARLDRGGGRRRRHRRRSARRGRWPRFAGA